LITADAGESDDYRVKLWKVELAKLAQETGLEIIVVTLPTGNVEVEQDRAQDVELYLDELARSSLVSYRTIVELISNTTTTKGLRIRAEGNRSYDEISTNVSADVLAAVPLRAARSMATGLHDCAISQSGAFS
jgi:hypothetical protein